MEMNSVSNKELFELQKKKIRHQDNSLNGVIGLSKEGKKIAVDLNQNLEYQVKLLNTVEEDVI